MTPRTRENERNPSDVNLDEAHIAIIGLGYVGLPLAVEFGKYREVLGYDINESRIRELGGGTDRTLEVSDIELAGAVHLRFTADPAELTLADVYIVTTPTPVDGHNQPDLSPVLSATETLARTLR
ncbi:MAG: hypothetical protein ACYC3U_04350, partial [Georgenia sp.]